MNGKICKCSPLSTIIICFFYEFQPLPLIIVCNVYDFQPLPAIIIPSSLPPPPPPGPSKTAYLSLWGAPRDWTFESLGHLETEHWSLQVTWGLNVRVYGSPGNWIFESRATWKLNIVLLWTSRDLICGKFGSCSIRGQYAANTLSRHSKQCFHE